MKFNVLSAFSGFALLLLATLPGCEKDALVKPVDRHLTSRTVPECCVPSLPSADEVVWNGSCNITITAHNDATKTYVTISRAGGTIGGARYANPGLCPTQTNGPTIQSNFSNYSFSFDNPADWVCGTPVTFSFYFNGLGNCGGNAIQTCVITYNLKDVCPVGGCDDSLSADVNCDNSTCNRQVTFTYTASDNYDGIVIQGGLTAHTSVCDATATGGDLHLNATHSSAGGPSNVTRWEASNVTECQVYTVTLSWTSTNGDPSITGQWTVKDLDGNTLATLAPLTCND